MKKSLLSIRGFLTAALAIITLGANATVWDFSSVSATDQANLNADTQNWTYDSTNKRWEINTAQENSPLLAKGIELEFSKGLNITSKAGKVRVDSKKGSLTLNGDKSGCSITIPNLKTGDVVTVVAQTSKGGVARIISASNVTPSNGFSESADKVENSGSVIEDGDVTISTNGGFYVYKIEVTGEGEGPVGPTPSTPDHSAAMNPLVNQMLLTTTDNSVKYYNTADLESVDIDKTTGKVTVTPKAADWTDEYLKNVNAISFAKTIPTGSEGEIVNRGINITEAKGWLESAYVKWEPFDGATSYNVYVKGGKYADYTKIDRELVRDYGTYCRADMVGLPENVYALKVVPVVGGAEDTASASEATDMAVKAHDRSGFAFHNRTECIGAYDFNGNLKANARVLYITSETAKTVKCLVKQNNKDGNGTEFIGLQAILDAYEKGLESRPLAIRFIGKVSVTDLDKVSGDKGGLQIKGKNDKIDVNITFEGIGEDATLYGFGLVGNKTSSVEIRNLGLLWFKDDGLSLKTASHTWVHNLDIFYGQPGSASDQVKGDGSMDVKDNSQYVTFSYVHLWDSGKTSLCGMKSETGPNYIDYHHNWFDHSDSRHPRIRTMSVHVWNNYYDGVAKYGVGAAYKSCAFVESNFYRNTKNPMLISMQGTDIASNSKGTFSSEDGGIIKSYGNLYAEASNKQAIPVTFQSNGTEFDCYEAKTRDEKVPSSVKAKQGGKVYDNFDTDPVLMHTYTPIPAADVPATVMGFYGAGRLNKGDFKWTFDNSAEDKNYEIIIPLQNAIKNYKSSLVKIF